MRQSLEEEGYKPPQYDDERGCELVIADICEYLSFKQLNDNASENIEKKIYSSFTIAKVAEYCFWWYNSCNRCHHQVSKVGKSFKCDKCPRTIPVSDKRFRVLITAQNSTFSYNFLLMDRVVKPMIGISASNLKKATDNDPKIIPGVIAELASKEINVSVEVIEDNNSEGGFLFHAIDFYDTSKPSTSATYNSSPPHIPAITLTNKLDHIRTNRTLGSAISVNKKIKMV
ncbi:hypothetical protein POM88_012785 [Heracleum sosnowskyi]|uniref:Replication factor A C-terminal domain-containing protein n=1 Tax=Heracleum sosnowskyi TaxID=360622 RepID=A0AAD8IX54_9APIA|nr:hypothetical protein POM88_012785 [Heracleum sosnowskyi]